MPALPNLRLVAILAVAALAAPVGAQTPLGVPLSPPPAAPASYQLGALDIVEVSVANFPELTTKTRIGDDGGITLPLVGKVGIAGLTQDGAARKITDAYRGGGYINAPTVRVEVAEFQSRRVSVLGEVTNQGLVTLDRPYTLGEILARTGGLTPAAADHATIVRQRPGGTTEKLTIDLTRFVEGVGATTPVQAGDLIVVPRAATISVIGAVTRAGVYRMSTGMTVDQAMATAGDVNQFGSRKGMKIRRTVNGTVTTLQANLDTPVQAGDVVIVRERLF